MYTKIHHVHAFILLHTGTPKEYKLCPANSVMFLAVLNVQYPREGDSFVFHIIAALVECLLN